ncbi:hypothetical protein ACWCQP_50430 [Streptomyces chartreusis]
MTRAYAAASAQGARPTPEQLKEQLRVLHRRSVDRGPTSAWTVHEGLARNTSEWLETKRRDVETQLRSGGSSGGGTPNRKSLEQEMRAFKELDLLVGQQNAEKVAEHLVENMLGPWILHQNGLL